MPVSWWFGVKFVPGVLKLTDAQCPSWFWVLMNLHFTTVLSRLYKSCSR